MSEWLERATAANLERQRELKGRPRTAAEDTELATLQAWDRFTNGAPGMENGARGTAAHVRRQLPS